MWRAMIGGGLHLSEDPIRLMASAGGVALLRVLAAWAWWGSAYATWTGAVIAALLALGVSELLAIPFRAYFWSVAGAPWALDRRGLLRLPPLAIVRLVAATTEGLLMAIFALIPLAIAAWLVPHGPWVTGLLFAALAALLAGAASLLVRSAFATAEPRAVLSAAGPWRAMVGSARDFSDAPVQTILITALGDLLLGTGAALGGVGVPAAWAWVRLAYLYRWRQEEDAARG